jgi:hypothetical protein
MDSSDGPAAGRITEARLPETRRTVRHTGQGERGRNLTTLKIDTEREREKALMRRARRAADMRACRKRQANGIALYTVAADETTFAMMERFAGLDPNKAGDKNAVQVALGRLLRAGLQALIEVEARKRR